MWSGKERTHNIREITVLFLVVLLASIMATIDEGFATDYTSGVSAGYFAEYKITYGSAYPDDSGSIDTRPSWFRMEVQNVSGTRVTFRLLAQGPDGSTPQGSGNSFVCDIQEGSIDGMYGSAGPLDVYPRFLLVAANRSYSSQTTLLFEHDIFAHIAFDINEMRTYLGINRNVNVFNETTFSTYPAGNGTSNWNVETAITENIVFDKTSGILVEATYESKETSPNPILNLRITTELISTNVFLYPNLTIPELPNVAIPFIIALLTVGSILRAITKKTKVKND
jgi:hypothetical protein